MSSLSQKLSTTSPLGIGGIWAPSEEHVHEWTSAAVSVFTDQDGELRVYWGATSSHFDSSETFPVIGGSSLLEQLDLPTGYFKLEFENTSGFAQTALRIQTKLFHEMAPVDPLASTEYVPELQLASGSIAGARRVIMSARGTLVTGVDRIPADDTITYPPLTAAESWQVVSTDNADSAGGGVYPLGAGAWEVTIEGINSAGAAETQGVTLDGTNPVPVPGSWLCVNKFYVSNLDPSVTSNVGQINLQIASTTTLRGAIAAGNSEGYQMRYRSPLTAKLYLGELSWGTQDYAVIVQVTVMEYNPQSGIYKRICMWDLDDAAAPQKIDLGHRELSAGSEVVVLAQLSAGTHLATFQLICDEKDTL